MINQIVTNIFRFTLTQVRTAPYSERMLTVCRIRLLTEDNYTVLTYSTLY